MWILNRSLLNTDIDKIFNFVVDNDDTDPAFDKDPFSEKKEILTLSILMTTQESFVNSVDQDQTAQIYTVHIFILDYN